MQKLLYILFLILLHYHMVAQQFLIDQPVNSDNYTFYKEIGKSQKFYYFANNLSISLKQNGEPKFSFLKYDFEGTDNNNSGGVLTFVMVNKVDQSELQNVSSKLSLNYPEAKVVGPVSFKDGAASLICSLQDEKGNLVRNIVGTGRASILEGAEMSFSMNLTKNGSDILWETFNGNAPDVAISLEMEIVGYLSPIKAKITANWDQIYKHKSFEVGGSYMAFSGEIKAAFDDLKNSGAIKVEQVGEDQQMDKIIENAYDRLASVMFDKVPMNISDIPSDPKRKSMQQTAIDNLKDYRKEADNYNNNLLDKKLEEKQMNFDRENALKRSNEIYTKANGGSKLEPPSDSELNSHSSSGNTNKASNVTDGIDFRNQPKLSIAASFRMKKQRNRGKYVIDLSKSKQQSRIVRFDKNLENVKQVCPSCFRRVKLNDPLYLERNITVNVDQKFTNNFSDYINSAELQIRKKHQDGNMTEKSIIINGANIEDEDNLFQESYGWSGDDNRAAWNNYDYRVIWNYTGGVRSQTEWIVNASDEILVISPDLEKVSVLFDIDTEIAARAIEINLKYKLNDKDIIERSSLRFKNGIYEIELPALFKGGIVEYEYSYVLHAKGGAIEKEWVSSKNTINFIE